MTVAPPTWPSSRVLAGWWPSLDRLRPRSLWLYHLLLHRIEAPVAITPSAAQERLARLLLGLLVSPSPASDPATTTRLADRLHVDPQLLRRLLADLERAGLVRSPLTLPSPPGGEGKGERGEEGWAATPEGKQVAAGAASLRPTRERRTFYFSEPPVPGAPRFIPLDRPPSSSWSATEDWRFDVGVLRATAEQSAEWKRRHGFPVEVAGQVSDETGEAWERVVIDRPEQMLMLFVLSGVEAQEKLLGFAVRPDGWHLQTERPLLSLGDGWREVLPELSEAPPEAWRSAWRTWGQLHGLPAVEVEASYLEQQGVHLRVKAPQLLAERLHASRGDLKGEMWLLAGEGRLRNLAVIELAELGER